MTVQSWGTFFETQAAAFAAVTGLVFVALSINLKVILTTPGTTGRAGEALVVLVEPVLLGLAGLVAHQSMRALGTEWLVVGVVGWLVVTAIIVRGRSALRDRTAPEAGVRLLGAQAATLAVVVGATLLAAGTADGYYWQAAGVALCLVVGIADAWVLLVEILR